MLNLEIADIQLSTAHERFTRVTYFLRADCDPS